MKKELCDDAFSRVALLQCLCQEFEGMIFGEENFYKFEVASRHCIEIRLIFVLVHVEDEEFNQDRHSIVICEICHQVQHVRLKLDIFIHYREGIQNMLYCLRKLCDINNPKGLVVFK